MTSWVLHVDLDQFLAAVEVLRRPELAGLPIIVGGRGDPTERAVVSTASYEARAHGIRSGMPLKVAVRKCPEAVLLPVDFEACNAASEAVMAVLRAQPGAVVELLGWDEAFVGVDTDEPHAYAATLQRAVLSQTGLHCSVGIGDTKVRAKIATDFGKPQGIYQLTEANWFEVMGERPTNAIWGIGPRISARLERLGARTVGELAELDTDLLVAEFGPRMGPHFANLGQGVSSATVDDTPWIARAHGHERTYQTNLVGREAISDALRVLADEVIADLRDEKRACTRVGLKVRFAPFFTVNRIRKLPEPTFSAEVIAEVAMALFDKLDDDRPVRLLGIRGEMVPPRGGL